MSDVYFERVKKIIKTKGLDKQVKGEVRAASLPADWNWAVFAGLAEVLELFDGIKVDIKSLSEGTIFSSLVPVLTIEGKYTDFAIYETTFLGLLCQASGVATKAARCKKVARGRRVYSFGARRMHPAVAPMIERNAFIGGCDGVSAVKSAELINEQPIGTMSHSLILLIGDEKKAFKAFEEVIEPRVKRIALVDTFEDEKFGALNACEALGEKLFAVRLDTPSSRRGNFLQIMREVRWELNLRGYDFVKIFVSGGADEYKISEYNDYADAYGVGTSISNAPVVDFSFDIIEVDGKPIAKRGKMSGTKVVLRCEKCLETQIVPEGAKPKKCKCGGIMKSLLQPVMMKGKSCLEQENAQMIREYVLSQLELVDLEL